MIRAIDICAGAGGWACAAERLDSKNYYGDIGYEGKPIQIVAAVDFAEDCLATYKYNHDRPGGVAEGCEFIHKDVREVNFTPFIGGIDLMLGGIPCETITRMRNQAMPSGDELFDWLLTLDACLNAVKAIKPAWWCLEDVVEVVNHLPEGTPFRKINSNQFSPQNRNRAYIGDFPAPKPGVRNDLELIDCLNPGPHNFPLAYLNYQQNPRGSAWRDSGTVRELAYYEKCPTIVHGTKNPTGFVIKMDDGRRRLMNLSEMGIAQGFPSDYVFIASRHRMAKMIGQAVQVDTGVAILEAIVKAHQRQAA